MKKSLFALAALGAFAGAAQAQSSVTLFGTIDAGVQYISNGGLAGSTTTAGTDATAAAAAKSAIAAAPATGSNFAYYDSAIASSQWGMKGTEDLGGGLKANFYLAGDANTNNGGTNTEGLFRRGAWVGLQGGFGEVRLGTQANPIVTSSAALLPVMGNTVNGVRTAVGYSIKDFNRNAIGYLTPDFGGFGAELQYAANNTMDAGLADGTAMNVRAFYSAGALDINAAYQKRTSMSATGNAAQCAGTVPYDYTSKTQIAGAAPAVGTGSTSVTCAAANYGGDVTGYLAGIKYKVTPAIQLGFGWAHGEGDNTNYVKGLDTANSATTNATLTSAGKPVTATTPSIYNSNAFMAGVGYQATPSVLLGLNYIVTTADSSMYNFQTRYALSKRTTAYFQASMMKNGAGSMNGSTSPYGNFLPLGGQTNTSPSVQVQTMTALPNTTQSAYGVGIIHNF
ncbi:porin [Polynucleobacter sp. SHI8]|uniref:porin n=1 Tax=unclassified Polynucleobacter TaxID=2640945 RepID=UPI002492AFE5|nr:MULTISPECIES: porin [unclassified Polynucleobacter]BDW10044.1 porin [Polynucleobacter sp. SHI2]BDW12490.1 porin [Polynucleobacter sp. SHI8]